MREGKRKVTRELVMGVKMKIEKEERKVEGEKVNTERIRDNRERGREIVGLDKMLIFLENCAQLMNGKVW